MFAIAAASYDWSCDKVEEAAIWIMVDVALEALFGIGGSMGRNAAVASFKLLALVLFESCANAMELVLRSSFSSLLTEMIPTSSTEVPFS